MPSPQPEQPRHKLWHQCEVLFDIIASAQAISRTVQDSLDDFIDNGPSDEIRMSEDGNPVVTRDPHGHSMASRPIPDEFEIHPEVANFIDCMALLPQSTRLMSFRSFFNNLKDFIDDLPPDMSEVPSQPRRPAETISTAEAGPSNTRRSSSRRTTASAKNGSKGKKKVSPSNARVKKASPPNARGKTASPSNARGKKAARKVASPPPTKTSRFKKALDRLSDIAKERNERQPGELYKATLPPAGDRSLRRQEAIHEDDILVSDPRYNGMGDLQKVIHARHPVKQTAPGTRVPLERQGALTQDDILRMSKGVNLQETVVARDEFSKRRRAAAEIGAEVDRKGKKRARDEDVGEGPSATPHPPPTPKRQRRAGPAAVQPNITNPFPPPITYATPFVGRAPATVITPQNIEPAPTRRSTRIREKKQAEAERPQQVEVQAPPPKPPKKSKKSAKGTGSKVRAKKGAK
ncbi:hypothetical protein CVT24_004965 [Panaeolus cyanescens]|uniref:Uncharacterized protein n=1 Tax=Panaeolus cyanescens TaxID=181874 RepID=A0A409YB36_9AGAR|nr:hypothetical protein CVT24_004965 [Panaeolus cyanescens]